MIVNITISKEYRRLDFSYSMQLTFHAVLIFHNTLRSQVLCGSATREATRTLDIKFRFICDKSNLFHNVAKFKKL